MSAPQFSHIKIVRSGYYTIEKINYQKTRMKRVCKVFGTQFVTPFSNASNIALRWSARKDTGFSIDMLLRWSKEVSL